MEEIISLILIALTMLTTFCLYKILDKRGLYFSMIIMNLISFVLTFKISTILKLNVNLGIIPLLATFAIMYLFIIKYGYKEVKNLIIISLYANVITSLLLITMNYFIPAITETISINMQGAFEYNFKILITYPIFLCLSQYITVKLFKLIKSIQDNNYICIMLTYIITALLYTVVMYILSYLKTIDIEASIFVGISTYIVGLAIMIINSIFVNYLTSKKVQKWEI